VSAAFGLDVGGYVKWWSAGAAGLLGRSAGQVLGSHLGGLLGEKECRPPLAAACAGETWSGVLRADCPGFRPLDAWFTFEPMTGLEGQSLILVTAAAAPEAGDELPGREARVTSLREASTGIGSTLDLRRTACEVTEAAVPRFCELAGVYVLERLLADEDLPERGTDEGIVVRRVALSTADADPAAWAAAFPVDEVIANPPGTPYAECVATGAPVAFTGLDPVTADRIRRRISGQRALARVFDYASFLVVPLKARGVVVGFCAFGRAPGGHPFTPPDAAAAEDLAARAGVCIDNARMYRRERRTALTLQASMLPSRLTLPVGVQVASRYLPADPASLVGGDWYDAIPLPRGRVALVVGDAMGHGTSAAAVMGQLRTAARALSGLGLSPAGILRRLDRMTQDLQVSQFATCVYAIGDPAARTCDLARAGHVPPILVHPDGTTTVLSPPPGLPLGVASPAFGGMRVEVPADGMLALYTDGLVENRRRDVTTGIEALRAALTEAVTTRPALSLEAASDMIIAALHEQHDGDDITLLLARIGSAQR